MQGQPHRLGDKLMMQDYNQQLENIRSAFMADGDPEHVLGPRSSLVDGVVRDAWRDILQPAFPSGMALMAVGGYGRSELFPYSDIDLMLLVEKTPDDREKKEAVSAFLQVLWDRGLRLSQSVRTPTECVSLHAQNVELNISLLDQRFLTGDNDLYGRLMQKLPTFITSERGMLQRRLAKLTRTRHSGFHDTIYHLEPNIKETPGGVRDIHLLWWLGKLQDPKSQGTDAYLHLTECRKFLYSLRCYLHYISNRDNNLLGFDAQEEIAAQGAQTHGTAAEWMREYFRNARQVSRAAMRALEQAETVTGSILSQFRDWRSRLSNSEFTVSRERVLLRSPQLLDQDPEVVLRLFVFLARHGLTLAADTENRLASACPKLTEYFSVPRPVWGYLREMLTQPHAIAALRAMHDSGVLKAIMPEWGAIECLVQRDFYHRYTVDEHTLITIENLLSLKGPVDPPKQRFADLLTEIDTIPQLIFALLFHDVGKENAEAGHAVASAVVAREVGLRIQMPEEDMRLVDGLIRYHLALSSVINSRDLADPATAQALAEKVGTIEMLRSLTLLTFSDISAVNPTAMTPWRMEQLWRVYIIGYRELTRELDTDRITIPDAARSEREEFLAGLPSRYLRTHSDSEIDRHLKLSKEAEAHGVAIELFRSDGVWRLVVVTTDRVRLFASLAGALASFGMNILKAEAFANSRGMVIDSFAFADVSRTLELNPSEIDRLRTMLLRAASGKIEIRTLLQGRPKPAPPSRRSRIKPQVHFDNSVSDHATLIEIVAEDRPGLLFDLASTFAQAECNIEVVLIDTEAHKALDVFYVNRAGSKLDDEILPELERQMLALCQPQ